MEPVDVANTFFTILTLLANAVVVVAVVLALAGLISRSARRVVGRVVDVVGPSAALLAWFVAATATLGSLYYSEIADFVPCRLCWFQRIGMYPLAVILLVGLVLRDHRMRWYAAPFVAVGIPLSAYHFLMEQGVFHESSACSATVPCAVPWFTELGYVTLAFMALSGFLLIGTLLVVDGVWARRSLGADESEGAEEAEKAESEDSLSPDPTMAAPTGNHGVRYDDAPRGADEEPGPDPALEVRT